jgi:glycosyltransferase involved in cell wall biosynthesis
MSNALPKLTVGLPVYNGERYLAPAIEAFLGQTFGDFDLVISDNASTDGTADICRRYADRDKRVRYSRNERNLGAGPNLNKVYELSRPTAYFKWTAADDEYAPAYLERCVAVLDRDPTVVLCHSRTTVVGEAGEPMRIVGGPAGHYAAGPELPPGERMNGHAARWEDHYDRPRRLGSASPAERFREVLLGTRRCFEIWGVMRRAGIDRTHLHESYYGSDKVMLSALALAGRFVEVPEPLYFRRHHGGSSDSIKSVRAREAWMDTRLMSRRVSVPRVKCFAGYRRSLAEAGLPLADRVLCYATLARYLARGERWMAVLREPW